MLAALKMFTIMSMGGIFWFVVTMVPLDGSWFVKNPEGLIAIWLEILGTYDFEIKHRADRIHSNADEFSRHPCLTTNCSFCLRAENKYEKTEGENEPLDCNASEHILA